MTGTAGKVEIGNSGKFLEGVNVTTPAGADLFREGVVVSDPVDPDTRQRVRTAEPLPTDDAAVVRVVGLNGRLDAMNTEKGAWSYLAGTAGTVNVGAGKRILQITATADGTPGTITINGGVAITVPAGRSLTIEPKGNLIAPTIVFAGTTAYFIEEVL